MDMATVRNGIVSVLKADSAIITEFTPSGGSGPNVDYGIPDDVPLSMLPKSIRVAQASIDPDAGADIGNGQSVFEGYNFVIVAVVQTIDAKVAEDSQSAHDSMIRTCLRKNYTFGDVATDSKIGRTLFRHHPRQKDVHLTIIQVQGLKYGV